MRWPTALLACVVVIAATIVYVVGNPAESQARGAGFMMAAGSASYAWRVNTTTGSVSYCVRRSDSSDPGYLNETAPVCSAFSPPVQ